MRIAALKGAVTTGLVVIALATLSGTASGAEGVSNDGLIRCDAGLPVGQVTAPPVSSRRSASARGRSGAHFSSVQCPCNACLADGPTGVPLPY